MRTATERCYLYGVVSSATATDLTSVPGGAMKGEAVTVLECGDVAALVSPLGSERVRSSRADLSAHERVVEHVASSTTILPLQFGVVMADSGEVVDEFLAPNHDELVQMLADLGGKAEHRLKATYVGDVALRDAVAGSRTIQHLQQRIKLRSAAAAYHDRIQLGELVASALEQIKAHDTAEILDRIEPYVVSTAVLSARRDDVAVHAALLVDNAERPAFDAAVDALAGDLEQRMSFELVGPLAPWDFVADGLATTARERPVAGSSPGGR